MKNICTCLVAVLLLSGCGKKAASPKAAQPEPADSSVVKALETVVGKVVLKTTNMAIPPLKASSEAGQTVVLEGKVMGTREPFVENRAVMVVGDDATITTCDLMDEDDHCETPWDACCVDGKIIQAGTAVVQVVGKDGQPLHAGLKRVNGLKELSRVRVSGTVADGSNKDILIVNAEAIQIL